MSNQEEGIELQNRQPGQDAPEAPDIDSLHEEALIQHLAISRVIEACRFVIPAELLDQTVTHDNLLHVCTLQHVRFHEHPSGAPPPDDLREVIRRLWGACTSFQITCSFRHLLEFDNDHFPVTTDEQRAALRKIVAENKNIVHKNVVKEKLEIDDDDKIVQTIFGSELDQVPAFVLASHAAAMGSHPNQISFVREFSRSITNSHRNMALLIPFVIVFFVAAFTLTTADIPSTYRLQKAGWNPSTDDWQDFCPGPGGPTNTSCAMTKRDLYSELVTETSTTGYFGGGEIIAQLWPGAGSGRTASDTVYNGLVLVGALLMKTSPRSDSPFRKYRESRGIDPNAACPVTPCAALNLSVETDEFSLGPVGFFSCDAHGSLDSGAITIIPFNTTYEQAMALAQRFKPDFCEEEAGQATIQWALYDASNGILTWTTTQATMPKPGSVIPRARSVSVKLSVTSPCRVLLVCQAAVLVWVLCVSVLTSGDRWYKRLSNFNLIIHAVLFIIIFIAYVQLSSLEISDTGLEELIVQDVYVPGGVDQLVKSFNVGMDLVALWAIVFFLQAVFIFRDVIGIAVVMRLLSAAAADVVGLIIIFSIIFLAFVAIARAMFGPTDDAFTTSTAATVALLNFLWGSQSNDITVQNPVSGGIFYFIFFAYIAFLVLNIFVAVVFAPLEQVTTAANLHLETFARMEADVSNFSRSEFRWFGLRKKLFPIVNAIDSCTFSRFTSAFSDYEKIVTVLYDHVKEGGASVSAAEVATAAYELIVFASLVPPASIWDTALVRSVVRYKALPHRPSWVLCKKVLMLQSSLSIVRDSALTRVLIAYDEMSTPLEDVIAAQEAMRDTYLERLAAMRDEASSSGDFSPASFAASAGDYSAGGGSPSLDSFAAASQGTKSGFYGEEPAVRQSTASFMRASFGDFDSENAPNSDGDGGANNNDTLQTLIPSPSFAPPITSAQAVWQGTALGGTATGGDPNSPGGAPPSRGDGWCGDLDSDACAFNFYENRYIFRSLRGMIYFPLLVLAFFILYLTFIVPLLLTVDEGAFLGKNVLNGIRDRTFATYCADAKCKDPSLLHSKTFNDVSALGDIPQFFEDLVKPVLFPNPDRLPFRILKKFEKEQRDGTSHPVLFDRGVRRVGDIVVRQLQARRKARCALPAIRRARRMTGANRVKMLYSDLECYEPDALDAQDLVRPAGSLLPPKAYTFQRGACVECARVNGYFASYPCDGIIANISTVDQLEEVMTPGRGWLMPATRLFTLSATFKSTFSEHAPPPFTNRVIQTRLDLYVEMMAGGAAASSWAFVSPDFQPLYEKCIPGLVLVACELALFFVQQFNSWFILLCLKRSNYASHVAPQVPWFGLASMLACIVLSVLPHDLATDIERKSLLTVVVIMSATNVFLYRVVFPLLKLVTYRAAESIRTVVLAFSSIGIVIPYFVSAFIAFTGGAYLAFGRQVNEFSTLTRSTQTMASFFFGDLDAYDSLYSERPLAAVLFILAFFAVVLTILANLLLSLVGEAANVAHRESEQIEFIQAASDILGQKLYCDEAFATYLSWRVSDSFVKHLAAKLFCWGGAVSSINATAEQREQQQQQEQEQERQDSGGQAGGGAVYHQHQDNQSNNKDNSNNTTGKLHPNDLDMTRRYTVTEHGRFRRPAESMTYLFSQYQLRELSQALDLQSFPELLMRSLTMTLVRMHQDFKQRHREQYNDDEKMEARLAALLQPIEGDADGSALVPVAPSGGGGGGGAAASAAAAAAAAAVRKNEKNSNNDDSIQNENSNVSGDGGAVAGAGAASSAVDAGGAGPLPTAHDIMPTEAEVPSVRAMDEP